MGQANPAAPAAKPGLTADVPAKAIWFTVQFSWQPRTEAEQAELKKLEQEKARAANQTASVLIAKRQSLSRPKQKQIEANRETGIRS